jgi:5-methylcytosine-specific restriction endonuclease McrA
MPLKNKNHYRDYMREYMKDRYRRYRAAAADILGAKCSQCGGAEELQFDHVNPKYKEARIDRLFSTAAPRRMFEELGKCQLLCFPCHRKKSIAQRKAGHQRSKYQGR